MLNEDRVLDRESNGVMENTNVINKINKLHEIRTASVDFAQNVPVHIKLSKFNSHTYTYLYTDHIKIIPKTKKLNYNFQYARENEKTRLR